MYDDRKYIIVNSSDITEEMIASSLESSEDTVRKTLDGNKSMLKWSGNTPSCFDGIDIYTYSEILEILKGEDWTDGLG